MRGLVWFILCQGLLSNFWKVLSLTLRILSRAADCWGTIVSAPSWKILRLEWWSHTILLDTEVLQSLRNNNSPLRRWHKQSQPETRHWRIYKRQNKFALPIWSTVSKLMITCSGITIVWGSSPGPGFTTTIFCPSWSSTNIWWPDFYSVKTINLFNLT